MKIKSLEIKGFRSLRDLTWEPGDLNVVIGPNGSGKSNLLQFFDMVSASAKGKLGDWVQEGGGITQVVWNNIPQRLIYEITLDENQGRESSNYKSDILSLENYSFSHETMDFIENSDDRQFILPVFRRKGMLGEYFKRNEEKFRYPKERMLKQESFLSILLYSPEYISNWGDLFHNLPKFAIFHEFSTVKDAKVRRPIVTRYEKHLNPDGQNLISVLHTLYSEKRNFKNDINDAMKAAFGDEYEDLVFAPAGDQLIQMRIRWRGLDTPQSSLNISDGTLRFLYLITILAMPDPPPLIAIDEPETGLHPSMLPIIAEYAADAADRTQVIFTTHSPEFLDAMSDLNPTVTVTDCKDGETSLTVLDGEKLEHWLKGYRLGKMFKSGELDIIAEDQQESE